MKTLIFTSIITSILFVPFILEESWQASENLFYGSSSFEKLPSIISDEPSNFELKIRYTEGPYAIMKLTPIFDASPKDAKQYVQIKTDLIDGLYRNDVGRIRGTITVDPQIQYEKVFVSVYFNGTDTYGNLYKSAWMDSATIDIKKQTHESSPELEKEKSTCLNPDSKVPLYGCSDVMTVKIDSPLKQFKSGTPIDQIQCKEGFAVAIKASNNNPACVKQETLQKLRERGWAEPLGKVVFEKPSLNVKSVTRINTDQYLLEILNLQGNYVSDKEIRFDVHEKGFDIRCFSVYAEIYDSSGNKIWEHGQVMECAPGLVKSNFDNVVPFSGIKIGKAGEYRLVVQSRGYEITRTFSVIDQNLVRLNTN